jgi:hypothetical protein
MAAGTAPPPSSRRRHTVDEVIEVGEIVERRSLVVRSKSIAGVDWSDEPTEITVRRLPARPARDRRVLLLLASVACGLAALTLGLLARPHATGSPELEARAEMIGTTLDGEARAAAVRAEAIAASPVLRAGIETDAGTLADMAHDNDLVLPLQRGDIIEVFQVRDGKRALLLRLPAGAAPLSAPAARTRIEAHDHRVVVVAKAAIPRHASGVAGEIVLSTPVDLAEVSTRISQHASGAVLDGLGEAIVLVDGGTPTVRIPIATKSPVAGSLSLAAAVPATVNRSYARALLVASFLLLTIFALSVWRTKKQPARA